MRSDEEILSCGVQALMDALGDVEAERFITLIHREQFDYTKWRRNLWRDRTVEDISKAAMDSRKNSTQQ